MRRAKQRLKSLLRQSQYYTRTDMVYLARGGFWHYVGMAGGWVISIAILTAFGHLVPQEVYGEYKYILSVVGLVSIFALPGMKSAVVRSVAKGAEGSLRTAFRAKFWWSWLGAAILIILAGWYLYFGNLELAGILAVAAVLFPLRMSTNIFVSFWHGRKQFDVQKKYHFLREGTAAAAVIIALFLTEELLVIIPAYLITHTAVGGLLYLRTVRQVANTETPAGLVSFGKHLTLLSALSTVSKHLDKFILWHFLGPAQVAVYSFAHEPIKRSKGVVPIKALALPKLSEHGVAGSGRKRKIFHKFLLMFGLSVPAAALLAGIAPYVYELVFPRYLDSVVYFQVLTALIALTPVTVLGSSLVAEAQTRYLYIINTAVPVIKVGLFLLLVPIWGVWGMVGSLVASEVLSGGLSIYFFWRM